MKQGATERARGVPHQPGGDGESSEDAKKMFFSWNKLNDLLKIKALAFFWP
jgi:hypothetical protein